MDEEIEVQEDDGEASELPETDAEEIRPAGEELESAAEEAQETTREEIEEVGEVAAGVEVEMEEADTWAEAAGQEAEAEYFADQALERAEEAGGEVEHAAEVAHEGLVSITHEAGAATAEAWETVEEEAGAMAEEALAREYLRLSFQDGFRFGCGFTVAGCLVWLAVPLILGLLIVVLTALSALG